MCAALKALLLLCYQGAFASILQFVCSIWQSQHKLLVQAYVLADHLCVPMARPPQVYRDAALAEHEQVEIAADAARRAAGHSPFHNSRADEAYLLQRVDAAIPQDSVLYAAAHKYLRATFKNRSWTFAQRKRLVDRLAGIAGHLAAHPPRSHRGSPFSALFQPDGPPAAPRLPRDGGAAAGGAAKGDAEAYVLPAGFGARL